MPISAKTASQCLSWGDVDIPTLLYIIELEGTDQVWETDLVARLVSQAYDAKDAWDDPEVFIRDYVVPALRAIYVDTKI